MFESLSTLGLELTATSNTSQLLASLALEDVTSMSMQLANSVTEFIMTLTSVMSESLKYVTSIFYFPDGGQHIISRSDTKKNYSAYKRERRPRKCEMFASKKYVQCTWQYQETIDRSSTHHYWRGSRFRRAQKLRRTPWKKIKTTSK